MQAPADYKKKKKNRLALFTEYGGRKIRNVSIASYHEGRGRGVT